MTLDEYAEKIPHEAMGNAAAMVNLFMRQSNGFIGADGMRDVLRIVAICARREGWDANRVLKLERAKNERT